MSRSDGTGALRPNTPHVSYVQEKSRISLHIRNPPREERSVTDVVDGELDWLISRWASTDWTPKEDDCNELWLSSLRTHKAAIEDEHHAGSALLRSLLPLLCCRGRGDT